MQITIEVTGLKDLMILEDALLFRKNQYIRQDICLWKEEIQRIDQIYHQVEHEIKSMIYETRTPPKAHQEVG